MLGRRLRLLWGRATLAVRLDRSLPHAARRIAEGLADEGHEVGIVGGSVRDLLLGQSPHDWDLVTSASSEQILATFPHGRMIGAAREIGTVLIPQEGVPYEVTPYRGADLQEDLARRDFTINAMALGIDGRLVDPMGGQADLAAGRIRACGSPRERLAEDPLRMLRAIRLAAQFNFAIDPSLSEAIHHQAPQLARVTAERIGMEFGRLLITDRPAWGVEQLRLHGLLPVMAPELLEMVGVEQNQYHAYPVWEHALMALALVPPTLPLRLAALFHDVGKPRCLSVDDGGNRHFYRHEQVGAEMADEVLSRLRLDGETRQRAVHLVRYHMDLHLDGDAKDAALRRMVKRIGLAYMDDLIQLRRADRLASGTRSGDLSPENIALLDRLRAVMAADGALKVTDLQVNGHDVMEQLALAPGPQVREILEQLLDEVIEEPSRNSREWLMARLVVLAKQRGGSTS